jgi:hypothetical protein
MPDLLICVDRKDFPVEIPHGFYLPDSLPVVICGPVDLLNLPCFTILNSRQSPRLERTQAWILKTLEALKHFDPRETVLVSSLGTAAWDFLTWAGGRKGFSLILVFPAGSAQNFNVIRTKTVLDFGLDASRVLAIRPIRLGHRKPSAEDSLVRDRWVMALSRAVLPVSVRPNGNLDRLLSHPDLPSSAVLPEHQIRFEPTPVIKKPLALGQIQLPEWYIAEDYLIHWTRSCVGPYPVESRADYFHRIIHGSQELAAGSETLERILDEGVIRASTHLVRGGYPVVPFTERSPRDLSRLINWRSGLRRWTFEPYGIALNKSRLMELGARPVIYADTTRFHELTEVDKPFFQIEKSAGYDWKQEIEWRAPGDVRLDQFKEAEMVVLVLEAKDARRVEDRFGVRVAALTAQP